MQHLVGHDEPSHSTKASNQFYSDGMISRKHVFLVGSPRSGTSWLQVLLAQHPKIATTQETHLFNAYLGHLGRAWERYKSLGLDVGMTRLLSDDDFYGLCAAFAETVLEKIADSHPGATVVLEKTPEHVRDAPLILRLLPEVWFLHIIRDPRSVVSSVVVAARSWGSQWWSSSVVQNALLWRSDVTLGRRIGGLTRRYYEVRYEDLFSDGAKALESIFAWLELPQDLAFCQAALEACHIDRMQQGGNDIRGYELLKRTQAGFLRKGRPDAWKEELPSTAIATVEYLAGDLMQECGYSLSTTRIGSGVKLRVATHSVLESLEQRIRWTMDFAFKKAHSLA
jgi:sulfotransferase family protein